MKPLKNLVKSLAATAIMICTATPVVAANIYRPGTYGDKIHAAIQPFLPEDMTPIFFDHDDPLPFLKEIDPEAARQAGVSTSTLNHFIGRMADEAPHTKDYLAYAITDAGVPGNEPVVRFCAIVIMPVEIDDWDGAITHEALHCRNSQIRDTQAYDDYLRPIWKSEAPGISWESFTGFVDESLVAGLQTAFYAKNGYTEPPHFVQLFADAGNAQGNSIGTRTANNVIKKCFADKSCPTDSNEMLHILMDDQKLREDLIQDLREVRG